MVIPKNTILSFLPVQVSLLVNFVSSLTFLANKHLYFRLKIVHIILQLINKEQLEYKFSDKLINLTSLLSKAHFMVIKINLVKGGDGQSVIYSR